MVAMMRGIIESMFLKRFAFLGLVLAFSRRPARAEDFVEAAGGAAEFIFAPANQTTGLYNAATQAPLPFNCAFTNAGGCTNTNPDTGYYALPTPPYQTNFDFDLEGGHDKSVVLEGGLPALIGAAVNVEGYNIAFNDAWPPFTSYNNGTQKDTFAPTSPQGGYVVQPGVDFLFGIPVDSFTADTEIGLTAPIVYYTYASMGSNGIFEGTGASSSVGGEIAFEGRFHITSSWYLLVEDRFSGIFLPLGIKNSVEGQGGALLLDSTLTIKALNVNHTLLGVGYRWGNPPAAKVQ